MSQIIKIHPETPQYRLINQAVEELKHGGLIVYPTDSGYALGCQIGNKSAAMRIREIRQLDKEHHFTLMCRDLSELSTYAVVDNTVFHLLKAYTPGAYTFILKATHEVPRRLQHPKRRTIGIRVPDHPVALALLEALDEPMMTSTLLLPGVESPMIEPEAISDVLGKKVDMIIDAGNCGFEPTTVVDLMSETPQIVRYGKGDPVPFE